MILTLKPLYFSLFSAVTPISLLLKIFLSYLMKKWASWPLRLWKTKDMWYDIQYFRLQLGWSWLQTHVMALIPSCLSPGLLNSWNKFFCYFMFSFQHISNLSLVAVETFHTIALPHLQHALETSLQNLDRDTSSMDQKYLLKQMCCVHTSRRYMFVYLFCIWCLTSLLSLYSSWTSFKMAQMEIRV